MQPIKLSDAEGTTAPGLESLRVYEDILRGDLHAVSADDLLTAMEAVLSSLPNTTPRCKHMAVTSLSMDEVAEQFSCVLKHLLEQCCDVTSRQHWRWWSDSSFAFFPNQAIPMESLGLSEPMAKLAIRLAREMEAFRLYRSPAFVQLEAAVHARAHALNAVDAASADEFELNVLRLLPLYAPNRTCGWGNSTRATTTLSTIPNSESFAREALPLMASPANFRNQCELDWLDSASAVDSLYCNPSPDRIRRFSKAFTAEVVAVLERALKSAGQDSYIARLLPELPLLPAWSKACLDVDAFRPLFSGKPFTFSNGRFRRSARVGTLMELVSTMPPECAALLDEVVAAGVRQLMTTKHRDQTSVKLIATALVHLTLHVGTVRATPVLLHKLLVEDGLLLSNSRLCPDGSPIVRFAAGNELLLDIQACAKGGVPRDDVMSYATTFLMSGLIGLEALQKYPMHKQVGDVDILAAAVLKRDPLRLEELNDLGLFTRLATKFSIPVQLPGASSTCEELEKTMQDAINVASATDSGATSEPKTSARRPRLS